jgi:magnesium chelatase family protein
VLFLDELPEFDRSVLEALREPLETGRITISRAARQAEFPACFQLVAAMNPCPCGHLGDAAHDCRCTLEQVRRYRARISGPLLDRIDLGVKDTQQHCALNREGLGLLQRAATRMGFSARVYHRFQRLARTIADLEGVEQIAARHVAEAIQLRRFDVVPSA